ncbi:unnamed protein product [Rotaria sordida]|uniref:Uncharacterized protein n=1 Tax=Rotaria sordida TaxID=392033 RepID=A0A815DMK1_9BILA|nr:unnamed protein product [Rotaria sordida]CAF1573760.1 unnamed protein product [Rotaria sordida]
MAKYCNEIGKFWQLHADAIPIVLINIAATTCEQSYIFRANQFKKPLNLYNCVVAKSSYGKSPMLGLVQSSILAVRDSRPMKFREVGDKLNGSNHIRVIFNEATTAGVLDSLKGCTRMLMTEEGDVILQRMGAFLSPTVGGRNSSVLDDCRAQLINLYDHPEQYSKRLKNSIVEVSDSKLNILAGLTGELIQRVITRRAQNTLADAFNYTIGAMEERDDHLASRFGKSVDAVHRLAGLCQIIEFASDMVKAFVQRHGGFEDESISNEFLTKCVGERNTAPIILNTNANDTNTNDTNTNDTSANDTSCNGTSRNNTSSNNTSSNDTSRNDTSSNDTSRNDTSSNDTSANENFSCNRDHDMPLNNYTLNNDVNENFLQNEDSTVSAVENNDNHVEVDEQMFITSGKLHFHCLSPFRVFSIDRTYDS